MSEVPPYAKAQVLRAAWALASRASPGVGFSRTQLRNLIKGWVACTAREPILIVDFFGAQNPGLEARLGPLSKEIGILLPNNQRRHRSLYIQKDVLSYALCKSLWPVSATLASIFRMDSIWPISSSITRGCKRFMGHFRSACEKRPSSILCLNMVPLKIPHLCFFIITKRTKTARPLFLNYEETYPCFLCELFLMIKVPLSPSSRPPPDATAPRAPQSRRAYRNTSIIRDKRCLGPFSRLMHRALWWSWWGDCFL